MAAEESINEGHAPAAGHVVDHGGLPTTTVDRVVGTDRWVAVGLTRGRCRLAVSVPREDPGQVRALLDADAAAAVLDAIGHGGQQPVDSQQTAKYSTERSGEEVSGDD